MNPITQSSQRLYKFYRGYVARHGYPPTTAEIEASTRITPVAQEYFLQHLKSEGMVTSGSGYWWRRKTLYII